MLLIVRTSKVFLVAIRLLQILKVTVIVFKTKISTFKILNQKPKAVVVNNIFVLS